MKTAEDAEDAEGLENFCSTRIRGGYQAKITSKPKL